MFRVLRPTWWLALLNLLGRHGRPYRGPHSDHFDGERFHNLEPKPHKSLGDVLKWRFSRPPQMQWVAQPGPQMPPEIVSRVHGAELRVTYINHATLLIQQHGLSPDRPLSSLLTAKENADLQAAAASIGVPGSPALNR